jgi:ribosomal protein S12 methylthiotransferase
LNKFFLDQHGCAKNQVDGEILITRLLNKGFSYAETPEEADVILINTCGFIESAKKESLESVFAARSEFPDKKIILCGCLAERYAESFADELASEVDAILGNGDLSLLDEVVDELNQGKTHILKKSPQIGVCSQERKTLLGFPNSAYVKITEGCNNCCSFCAIPVIRGNLRSRSEEEIILEIKNLIAKGIFEINLVGQDLAAFGRDGIPVGKSNHPSYFEGKSPLASLLEKLSTIQGDFWIRLLYIHPDHFPLDILPILKSDSRILPYFDIPFQSGSTEVLFSMNRNGTRESYSELVKNIREELPFSSIRTTFLCGFPGESEKNAKETEDFLKSVEPDWSGCFAYSREEDTPAYNRKNQVPKKKAEKRAEILNQIQTKITETRLKQHIGNNYKVLIEEIIDDEENGAGIALGRAWFQAPEVDGACIVSYDLDDKNALDKIKPGKVVSVKVLGVTGVDVNTVFLN